uniref:CUB domain-containing protein n=1 Tax=Panagrolaimus superbus TaxID=310955 RepID=A0A914YMD9_9BILA
MLQLNTFLLAVDTPFKFVRKFLVISSSSSTATSTSTTSTTSTTTTTTTSPPTTTTTQPYHTYICGNGTISSPGYPERYPNSLNATYILQATPGKVVRITFNYIYTEQNCDNITLFDGLFEDESNFITKYVFFVIS